jgi:hypothetical protein
MEILLYQTIRRFEPNLTITVGFSTHLFGGHLIAVRRHFFLVRCFLGLPALNEERTVRPLALPGLAH